MNEQHLLVSARFDGGEKEKFAREIHKELCALRVNAFMVEAGAGDNFATQTVDGLDQMYAMLAVSYDTYGAKTTSKYSTYEELAHAYDHGIPIIPLKLYSGDWPPAPEDSDGGRAGRAQNKFVFEPGLVYVHGVGKSALKCAQEVKEALAHLEAGGKIPVGASASP